MGCSTCATKDGQPSGCKNNGTCGTDGCNKLTVFDWLSNMAPPSGTTRFDCVEVRFKNSRKEFFRNSEKLSLSIGDIVATQAQSGHDIGMVTLVGELVKVQMKRKKEDFEDPKLPKVYRKASQSDIDKWQKCRDREEEIKKRAREMAIILKLQMKISDVEFQGDASKATFYYTAEERIDFRQLIKDMAKAFGIRIEMRQIGYRQEAQRLGGIGSCGRELCCSTWLSDFRSVSTSAARYQQLSLNPQKLAGQCGKLKCCLNYELDVYVDALKDFPSKDTRIETAKGIAFCQKVDIFKESLWFSYKDEPANWHILSKEQVLEILEKNKKKEKVASLEEYAVENTVAETVVFENVVGQDSLTRFDTPKKSKSRNKNRNRRNKAKTQEQKTTPQRPNRKPRPKKENTQETQKQEGTKKATPARKPRRKPNRKPNNNTSANTTNTDKKETPNKSATARTPNKKRRNNNKRKPPPNAE